jgi:hypothetical protein
VHNGLVEPSGRTPGPSPLATAVALLRRILLHLCLLLVAAGLFAAFEHYRLHGQSTPSLACLAGAALLALAPVRALLSELWAIEGRALHFVHGLGALVAAGLALSGLVSGQPVLTRAALAPFAMMGAAQAVMHQDHPRNPQQAAALANFARSLPEVEQFTRSGGLSSPRNLARAVLVLQDLIGKAQALGETELSADPGFQGALRQVTTRYGAMLGLDAVQSALDALARNPAAAGKVADLRQRLARARRALNPPSGSCAAARCGSGGAACAAPSPRSGGCARG